MCLSLFRCYMNGGNISSTNSDWVRKVEERLAEGQKPLGEARAGPELLLIKDDPRFGSLIER